MKRIKVLEKVRYGVNLASYVRKFPDKEIEDFCRNPVIQIHKEEELFFTVKEKMNDEEYINSLFEKVSKAIKQHSIFIEDKTLKGERWSKYECVKGLENESISPHFNKLNFVYITIDDKLFLELDNYADEKLGIKEINNV